MRTPPEFLTKEQRAAWRYAIDNAPAGVLHKIDRTALVIWVQAEDAHRRAMIAQAALEARHPATPMLMPSRTAPSGLTENPYAAIIRKNALVLLRAMAELGFSPASRPRIQAPEGGGEAGSHLPPESPWARLRVLQGGKGDEPLPPD